MSYSVLKRVMARKSIMGFGRSDIRDLSVQMLIDSGRTNLLINAYFNLDKIDFQPDILEELKITGEFLIQKPGKNPDLLGKFYDYLRSTNSNEENMRRGQRYKKITKIKQSNKMNKLNYINSNTEYLRYKNHGNK